MSAYVSLTELFSLGIGPSSSHTVGPMRAAADFAGARPETCDPDDVRGAWRRLGDGAPVALGGTRPVFVRERDVVFAPLTRMPVHTNALRLRAVDGAGSVVADRVYYSVGGGFVVPENARPPAVDDRPAVPFPFTTAGELLEICAETGNSIAEVADANEAELIGADRVPEAVDRIWSAMVSCIESGVATEGRLPGGLDVVRRAPGLYRRLVSTGASHDAIDWLQTYAMAVNEENAAGGRVVTAPTNGAAGIVPAVGRYYEQFLADDAADMRTFLLTATAIGSLVKANASISGAEAGCQGEVGSACAMAAGALCAVLGGTPAQVEYAAEIAMEHHLGLTCDPVGGLVQIPCIERNGIAAVTALSAARMALGSDGSHVVSLDTVIETMRQTGLDMSDKYKETSTGGLALNVVMC
ncbi:L-serine ammonia-lyase [Rhodococcus sp. NPDC057529]|uniref:L-serine ammonia-lyase n=1 Tax=Rhodococcus sp. NPDC057529 TaxID=3346158 RepID=UPI00366D1761